MFACARFYLFLNSKAVVRLNVIKALFPPYSCLDFRLSGVQQLTLDAMEVGPFLICII